MKKFNADNVIKDKRLTLSGTTDAGEQNYSIWSDGQDILVPKGQSITKPYLHENVQVNTKAHAGIRQGYFRPPIIEFTNTTNGDLFDTFILSTVRDTFPIDETVTINTFDINDLYLSFDLVIKFYTYEWILPQTIKLIKQSENMYVTQDTTEITTFEKYTEQTKSEYDITFHANFNIDLTGTSDLGNLQIGNHTLYMTMQTCKINRGSSEYTFNNILNPTLPPIIFTANNINIERGET